MISKALQSKDDFYFVRKFYVFLNEDDCTGLIEKGQRMQE
jgi:hypothetical protein